MAHSGFDDLHGDTRKGVDTQGVTPVGWAFSGRTFGKKWIPRIELYFFPSG